MSNRTPRLALAVVLALPLLGLPAGAQAISKVNGSVHVQANAQEGSISTVNGSVRLDEGASATEVETVNGSIKLRRGAHAESIEAVNGSITLDDDVTVSGGVETVNGSIALGPKVDVRGKVENVNGSIALDRARVGGDIETTSGDIDVGAGSRVDGGIRMEKDRSSWFNNNSTRRTPRVTIGAGAVVAGRLEFEREVELYVHDSAKIGQVSGAEVKRFSGAAPERSAE